MMALAEIAEGLTRDVGLFDGDGFDHDANAADERVTLPEDFEAELALDDYRKLDEISGRYAAARRVTDGFNVTAGVRFFHKDGNERGGVEDHLGRPCSS